MQRELLQIIVGDSVTNLPKGINSSEQKIIDEAGELNCLLRKLKDFCIKCQFSDLTSGWRSGRFLQAFCTGLNIVFDEFYKSQVVLESLSIAKGVTPLSLLLAHIRKYKNIFSVLSKITQTIEERKLKGGQICSLLKDSTLVGNTEVALIIEALSRCCDTVLCNIICAWVESGYIHDPIGEFFIEANDITHRKEKASDKLHNAIAEHGWIARFSIRHEMLPSYITPGLAESLLFVGKSVQILQNSWNNDGYNLDIVGFMEEMMNIRDSESPLDPFLLEQTIERLKVTVSQELCRLLKENGLADCVKLIRDYFLLARGEFFQALLDELGPLLQVPPGPYAAHDLRSIWLRVVDMIGTNENLKMLSLESRQPGFNCKKFDQSSFLLGSAEVTPEGWINLSNSKMEPGGLVSNHPQPLLNGFEFTSSFRLPINFGGVSIIIHSSNQMSFGGNSGFERIGSAIVVSLTERKLSLSHQSSTGGIHPIRWRPINESLINPTRENNIALRINYEKAHNGIPVLSISLESLQIKGQSLSIRDELDVGALLGLTIDDPDAFVAATGFGGSNPGILTNWKCSPSGSNGTTTWRLGLNLQVPKTLHILFSQKSLRRYDKLFWFLLKLRRVSHELNSIWLSRLRSPDVPLQHWKLRSRMAFVLSTFHNYLENEVLASQFAKLTKSFDGINDLQVLHSAHERFLQEICKQSFVEIGSVCSCLQRIFKLCMEFCEVTKGTEDVSVQRIESIETNFEQQFSFLRGILTRICPVLSHQLNFNGFYH